MARKLRIIGVQKNSPSFVRSGNEGECSVISIATAFMPLNRLMSGAGFSPNLLSFGLKPRIAFTFYGSLKATAIEAEPMNQ
jgi:hypothetical protein